jgi:hypothetical protein
MIGLRELRSTLDFPLFDSMPLLPAILATLCLWATFSRAEPRLADLDAFIERELKAWNAPGASLAVIHDGKVIVQKGYGLRDVKKLAHFHFETFRAPDDKLNDLAKVKAQFVTDLDGEVSAVNLRLEPAVKALVFTRLPEAHFADRAFLSRFEGSYEVGPTRVTVTLRSDGKLTLAAPGQPVREMAGVRGNRFSAKGVEGQTFEFRLGSDGKAADMVVNTPVTTLIAKRLP